MQAYARKLGDCLAELTKPAVSPSRPALKSRAAANSPALDQLRQWTQECSSLRVFLVVGNPKNFMAYISDRLDGTPGLRTCELGTEWYHDLLVRGHLFHLVLLVSFDHAWQMVALTITLQHLHHQTL